MNNENLKVKNIMVPIPDYPVIRAEDPIGDAVALILQHSSADHRHLHFEELLVIDSNEQLVGMVDAVDILKSFFPSVFNFPTQVYVGKTQAFTDLSVLLEDNFRLECKRQATEAVKQHMRVPHRSIDGSMHALHALEIMVKDREKTLPVTENNSLLGAVRVADLFRVLGGYCTM